MLLVLQGLSISKSPVIAAGPSDTEDITTSDDAQATYQFSNCRVGVSVIRPFDWNSSDYKPLNLGTYLSFSTASTPSGPNDMEFWQMAHVIQDRTGPGRSGDYLETYRIAPGKSTLEAHVVNNPGALWIIGNEPDRETVQDDTFPNIYAQGYHEVYYFIKNLDPTARIAVAGLVGFTPGREQYMDIVWDTYKNLYGESMPVDAWTIHPYVLWESGGAGAHVALGTDPDIAIPRGSDCSDPDSICIAEHDDIDLFAEQIVRMRQWMKRHGQQHKPLLVTEWGIILPYQWEDGSYFTDEYGNTFDYDRAVLYMQKTQDYFHNTKDPQIGYPEDDYRLVQQWSWFALTLDQEPNTRATDLVGLNSPHTITPLGQAWSQYMSQIPPTVDLEIEAHSTVVLSATGGISVSATLRNTGNAMSANPVTVNLCQDATCSSVIDSVTLPAQRGCQWGQKVTLTWAETTQAGAHPFWIEVTSPSPETQLDDNLDRGWIFIDPYQTFLPLVLRSN